MPTGLVLLIGGLAVVAGVLIFVLIGRRKPPETPHFR